MLRTIKDTKSEREFRFDGDLISHATTESTGRPRWSELDLYRTKSGQYVLVKAGRSLVFHATRSCGGAHAVQTSNVRKKRVDGIPCHKCGPAENEAMYFKENDLVTVIIARSAAGVVEASHIEDDDNIVFLPRIAHRMLTQAGHVDEAIREAFSVEVVL